MLRLVFCFFFICTRVSGSGLSMPTKIPKKFASFIACNRSSSSAITVIVERLQLGEYLIVGLGARHATIQLDNIAELAGERAATRILHADEEIMIEQILAELQALYD